MNLFAGINWSLIEPWIAFVLTLMVFSYLLGDNPLFRLAGHLFVGTATGYVVVIAYHAVLRPRLFEPLLAEPLARAHLLVPLLLGILLLAKASSRIAWMGNVSMGLLFGAGAALAVGGALVGTLATQVSATPMSLNPAHYANGWLGVVNALIMIVATIATLLYFQFTQPASRRPLGRIWAAFRGGWARLGRWFILVAFGALFANSIVARFTLLIGRVRFLLDTLGLLGS